MQTYEPARRPPYQSAIPAMRHAPERTSSHSATPIYDALYAEYRMAFRTLPGDRSGEEDLGFKTFAALTGFTDCTGFTTGLHGTGPHGTGLLQTSGLRQPGAGSGCPGPRQETRQLPGPSHTGPAAGPVWTHVAPVATHLGPYQPDRPGAYQTGTWRPVPGTNTSQDLLPAVLPPRRTTG